MLDYYVALSVSWFKSKISRDAMPGFDSETEPVAAWPCHAPTWPSLIKKRQSNESSRLRSQLVAVLNLPCDHLKVKHPHHMQLMFAALHLPRNLINKYSAFSALSSVTCLS